MKVGFITGRDDEVYDDEYLLSMTPKKYLVQGNYEKPLLHTDVAIAMTVKDSYPDVSVDIIQPKDITNQRLRKNDVNFILGYDCINQLIQEPYVRKFSGEKGYKLLHSIYSQPQNKVFPPMNFLEFIWAKDKYMKTFQRKQIPVSDTLFVSKPSTPKLLRDIQQKQWKEFIIKPVGGTVAIGVGRFKTKECLQNPRIITEYFDEYSPTYSKFLVQELIRGFKTYGEIKMFWINEEYSYAVNTIDKGGGDQDQYSVSQMKQSPTLEACQKIGKQALQALPKIKVKGKHVKPVLVRTDFTCCKENKSKSPSNYFLNEVEHQDAGSYANYYEVKYPYVQIMADAFVKKAQELISLGF